MYQFLLNRSGLPEHLIRGVVSMGHKYEDVGWVRVGANLRPFVRFRLFERGRSKGFVRVWLGKADTVKVLLCDVRAWPAGAGYQNKLFKGV